MATVEPSQAEPFLAQFEACRRETMDLVSTLEPDDYSVQTAPYTSPPKWHVGHTSWIYEAIMSKIDPEYAFYSAEFSKYLNSYYQQFGRPQDKASRGSGSRPTTAQILEYAREISSRVCRLASSGRLSKGDGSLLVMGMHHECQHQELLVYDLQHMLADKYEPARRMQEPAAAEAPTDPVRIGGGIYEMGHSGRGFCYDIELPEHKTYLNDYLIDPAPVTCGQYAEFVADGGYLDYRHWLSDGWEAVQKNGWEAPMYWQRDGDSWIISGIAGRRRAGPDEPVCNLSYYEADAYCKWAGKRLPTEAEWEKAALWDGDAGRKRAFPWGDDAPGPGRANLLDSRLWKPAPAGSYPAGASKSGCLGMIGGVWEWTSSEFVGYPGFESGFDEYNDKWFSGQKVLRGGSFATPAMSIRGSYRNFFRMDERWMFAGFRCASEAR